MLWGLECNANAIDNLGISFKNSVARSVVSGNQTSFWLDIWGDMECNLAARFPRLFALESKKDCVVSKRWVKLSGVWAGSWAWRCTPRGRLLVEVEALNTLIRDVALSPSKPERWWWRLDA